MVLILWLWLLIVVVLLVVEWVGRIDEGESGVDVAVVADSEFLVLLSLDGGGEGDRDSWGGDGGVPSWFNTDVEYFAGTVLLSLEVIEDTSELAAFHERWADVYNWFDFVCCQFKTLMIILFMLNKYDSELK